jgi:transcriptional antiterminator RfaH
MSYWAAARAQPQREALAQRFLELKGYTVYLPRLREYRTNHGRRIETRAVLFPGYLFCLITNGWWEARWCPGTRGLVMNCGLPVRVPEGVLDDIRKREVRGLVELPCRLKRGDPVRVLRGPFREQLALYQGQNGHERVAVLLSLLGGQHRVRLPRGDVEALS